MTKDSILYGVVSTVDVKYTGKKKLEADDLLNGVVMTNNNQMHVAR